MRNRFVAAAPALVVALVLGACQEAGAPPAPTVRTLTPLFATEGDNGDALFEIGPNMGPVQEVNMPSGSDFICVGAVTGVFDDVLVPPNALCILFLAEVRGNAKALENSTLIVQDSRVRGNIHGDKAHALQLRRNEVGGNIHIVEAGRGVPGLFEVIVCANTLPSGNIQVEKALGSVTLGPVPTRPDVTANCLGLGNTLNKGNIKVEDNIIVGGRRQGMDIRGNAVRQNVQVFKNTGPGDKFVQGNTAGEAIQCKENAPLFVGTPNAAPKREEQCAP